MRRAFTLIELLVVITLLAVLIALLFPATWRVRRAATRLNCQSNLRQLGLAAHNYRDTYQHFPRGTVPDTQLPPDRRLSLHATLLPYLEADPVFRLLKPQEEWDSVANRSAVGNYHQRLFQCREWVDERGAAAGVNVGGGHTSVTNYVGVAGVGADAAARPAGASRIGMFGHDRVLRSEDVKDGLANTAMLIETGSDLGPWLRGGPATVRAFDPDAGQLTGDGLAFGGTHFLDATLLEPKRADGFHLLLGDGSVRYTRNVVHPDFLLRLATVAGGEDIPADW
ncbi:MAG TPA: DUF1559 domain-containing protein [Gemmata sp.]|nr:DUF1559 domain-containing protein [Gemmata sp.]